MFELTRREQALVVGLVVVFLLGLGTMQWRNASAARESVPAVSDR
jgi:hypothetical protein